MKNSSNKNLAYCPFYQRSARHISIFCQSHADSTAFMCKGSYAPGINMSFIFVDVK